MGDGRRALRSGTGVEGGLVGGLRRRCPCSDQCGRVAARCVWEGEGAESRQRTAVACTILRHALCWQESKRVRVRAFLRHAIRRRLPPSIRAHLQDDEREHVVAEVGEAAQRLRVDSCGNGGIGRLVRALHPFKATWRSSIRKRLLQGQSASEPREARAVSYTPTAPESLSKPEPRAYGHGSKGTITLARNLRQDEQLEVRRRWAQ